MAKHKAAKRKPNKIIKGLKEAVAAAPEIQAATESIREWVHHVAGSKIRMHWQVVERADEASRQAARQTHGADADPAILEKTAEAIYSARIEAEEMADRERIEDFISLRGFDSNKPVVVAARLATVIMRALKKAGYDQPQQ